MKIHNSYRFLFYSGIVNGIGDRFSQVAVLTLLLELTGSGMAVGAVLGIRIIPYLVLSPLGGRLADYSSKKGLLILTDLLRIPFAWSFLFVDAEEDVWIIFLSMFILACGEAFYQPVRKSYIGTVTKPEHLMKVNGLEQLMTGVVLIGGSITGGIVAYVAGPSFAFWLNGFSFLTAAFLLLPLPSSRDKEVVEKKEHRNPMKWPGWVFFILVIQLAGAGMDGVFNVLISVYGVETFALNELGVGFLYGALGSGLVTSFFFSSKIKNGSLSLVLILLMVEGILHIMASHMPSFPGLVATFVCIALLSGVWGALLDTFLMRHLPKSDQGRVFGWMESLANVHLGIVMFGSGWLLDTFSPRTLGLWGGLSGVVGGLGLFIGLLAYRNRLLQSLEQGRNERAGTGKQSEEKDENKDDP